MSGSKILLAPQPGKLVVVVDGSVSVRDLTAEQAFNLGRLFLDVAAEMMAARVDGAK